MDSCILDYFFLAAAFFLAIISLNFNALAFSRMMSASILLLSAAICLVEGAGLPGWLPRTGRVLTGPRTGWVLTGPRPPLLGGSGLPGWLPRGRTGWVLTGPRPRTPVEGAGLPGSGLGLIGPRGPEGLTGPLPVYPAGGTPPIKRDM